MNTFRWPCHAVSVGRRFRTASHAAKSVSGFILDLIEKNSGGVRSDVPKTISVGLRVLWSCAKTGVARNVNELGEDGRTKPKPKRAIQPGPLRS